MPPKETKIIIVGGGFGGVRTALDLAKSAPQGTKIVLLSDKPHFEYHATLYRVVTGRSPLQVCIPLSEIFAKQDDVEVVIDTVTAVDLKGQTLIGSSGSRYVFDYLVLALGSETIYFDIPGLRERSFGFKSITEALRLKRHLHEVFAARASGPLNLVVIGGGASGVELAGELAVYSAKLAAMHNFDLDLVNIELLEASTRLVPILPPEVSSRIKTRLQTLGVNVFLNRRVLKEDINKLYTADMNLETRTVIWTAGVKPNSLYEKITGLDFDKRGRVAVDGFLQVKGYPGVFVVGDAAVSPYSGMAQTALDQGKYVARFLAHRLSGQTVGAPYIPKKPVYSIPVGPGWAATVIGLFRFYWKLGWWFRRFVDLRFFLSVLPWRKALVAFDSEKALCETCSVCVPEGGEKI